MRDFRMRGAGRAARLVAVGLAGLIAVGCGDTETPPVSQPAAKATGSVGPILALRGYSLYTHCGIDEALVGGQYYETLRPLSDGQGNPPAGWDNPYQIGTMTVISHADAVFTDQAGHRVVFVLRPGATSFRHVCS